MTVCLLKRRAQCLRATPLRPAGTAQQPQSSASNKAASNSNSNASGSADVQRRIEKPQDAIVTAKECGSDDTLMQAKLRELQPPPVIEKEISRRETAAAKRQDDQVSVVIKARECLAVEETKLREASAR